MHQATNLDVCISSKVPTLIHAHNGRWAAILILAMAAILYLPGLRITPPVQSAEIRCRDIVKHMLESGDYLVPQLRGHIRPHKPPLFYWMACGTAKIAGRPSLFTLRLPSVLAGLGILGILAYWCRSTGFSRELTALTAGGLAITYLFVLHARRGDFEITLTFFAVICLYACYRLRESFTWSWGLIASVSFGLGFLTKATPVFVFVPLPVLAWLLMQKQSKTVLLDWRLYLLLALAAGIGLSWYALIMIQEPVARRIIAGQALLPFGIEDQEVMTATHYASPFYYASRIWRCAFPISLLLPLIALHAWNKRGFAAESVSRLLLLAIILPFIVLSLVPQKQDHYLLPLYPYIALLGIQSAAWALQSGSRAAVVFLHFAMWVVVAYLMATGAIIGFGTHVVVDVPLPVAVLLGTATTACGLLTAFMITRRMLAHGAVASIIGICIFMTSYFGLVRPVEDGFASGTIRQLPHYDQEAWNAKFMKYPFLQHVLHFDVSDDSSYPKGQPAKLRRKKHQGAL